MRKKVPHGNETQEVKPEVPDLLAPRGSVAGFADPRSEASPASNEEEEINDPDPVPEGPDTVPDDKVDHTESRGEGANASSRDAHLAPFWMGKYSLTTSGETTVPITELRSELWGAQREDPRLSEVVKYLEGKELSDILSDPRKDADRLRERCRRHCLAKEDGLLCRVELDGLDADEAVPVVPQGEYRGKAKLKEGPRFLPGLHLCVVWRILRRTPGTRTRRRCWTACGEWCSGRIGLRWQKIVPHSTTGAATARRTRNYRAAPQD